MMRRLPLLEIQRELLRQPPGPQRFETYLEKMTGPQRDRIVLPIMSFNPMSKPHVARILDELWALNAEDLLQAELSRYEHEFGKTADFQVGLVVTDDQAGGWTCRETIEISRIQAERQPVLKQGFITLLWWTSVLPTKTALRESLAEQLFEQIHVAEKGPCEKLQDWVVLRREAAAFAGRPQIDPVPWALQWSHYLAATDVPTWIAAWYGDESARRLGYDALGFPAEAGDQFARQQNLNLPRL